MGTFGVGLNPYLDAGRMAMAALVDGSSGKVVLTNTKAITLSPGDTLSLSAESLVDPDTRLEPNEDWRVKFGRTRAKRWRTPNPGDWTELRRRLRDGRMYFGHSPVAQVMVVTNPHQKTYWFSITANRPGDDRGPYHHGPSSSVYDRALESAERFTQLRDRHDQKWSILVLANNQTQVKRWAARLAAVEWKEPEMPIYQGSTDAELLRQQADTEIAAGQNRALALLRRAEFLDSLPDEPQVEDGEPNVVYFTKVFDQGGTVYNYAAIQHDGNWYTSGPVTAGTPYSWQDLVKWIYTYRNGVTRDDAQIWHATGYEPL